MFPCVLLYLLVLIQSVQYLETISCNKTLYPSPTVIRHIFTLLSNHTFPSCHIVGPPLHLHRPCCQSFKNRNRHCHRQLSRCPAPQLGCPSAWPQQSSVAGSGVLFTCRWCPSSLMKERAPAQTPWMSQLPLVQSVDLLVSRCTYFTLFLSSAWSAAAPASLVVSITRDGAKVSG